MNSAKAVIGLVVIGVVLLLGIYIAVQVQNQTVVDTSAYNATAETIEAFTTGIPWLGILVIVVFAVIILGTLTTGLNGGRSGIAY